MRKLIYVVGGVFLSIGIIFFALAIKTALTYQPMQISASEFKKIFQDKKAYSTVYLHNKSAVLCFDNGLSAETRKIMKQKKLKCWSKVRSTEFSSLDKATQDQILKQVKEKNSVN